MDKNHKFYWHDGISISQSPISLVLDYSEPDQGGTRLCFRFRIPLSDELPSSLETGYSCEGYKNKEIIEIDDIPDQVLNDAKDLLIKQIKMTKNTGKKDLYDILNKFRERIEK